MDSIVAASGDELKIEITETDKPAPLLRLALGIKPSSIQISDD